MNVKRDAVYNWDGARLNELIHRAHTTRKNVADLTGITESVLHNYIRNVTKPDIDRLISLANVFAVPLDFLCGRCDEETSHKILDNYEEMYTAIRIKDYEGWLSSKGGAPLDIAKGFVAPWPYNLLDDIFREPFDHLMSDDEMDGLMESIKSLTPKEQMAIDNYYRKGMLLDEVGAAFGVKRERARQIIAKGVRKLRHPSRAKFIKYGLKGNDLWSKYEGNLAYIKNKTAELDEREKRIKELEENAGIKHEEQKIREYDFVNEGYISDESDSYPSEAMMHLDLSVRSYNSLVRADVRTVDEIIKLIRNERIYKIRGLGKKSVHEIMMKIGEKIGCDIMWEEGA